MPSLGRIYLTLLITSAVSLSVRAQEPSVLATGDWVKLGVTAKGIYKIDRAWLQSTGFDPQTIDPANIQLYGEGGGMLPQNNAIPRTDDLEENAIYTVGLEDGSFDASDYILFFAQGPNLEYINETGDLIYEKNLYADTSYYFMTMGSRAGKRMSLTSNLGNNHPRIDKYKGYRYHELDLSNILSSGREWYGELLASGNPVNLSMAKIPPLMANSQIVIIPSVLSHSNQSATFDFSVNGSLAGSISTAGVGSGTYDDKGVVGLDTLTLNQSTIGNSGAFNLEVRFNGSGSAHLNYIVALFHSPLTLHENVTFFREPASLSQNLTTYSISNIDGSTLIWDITDPQNVRIQEFAKTQDKAVFGASSSILREYVVFRGNNFPLPSIAQTISNQDLHSMETPNLLIVTAPAFISQAERLAAFRFQNDGISVRVVTPQQIYHEFSSGRQDVSAIRDFVRYLHQRNPVIKYLLLFGRCSYDFKNIFEGNTNFVPTYQSRNSLDPIFSYNSDDYFGFLDDDEGEWLENLSGTGGHLMDVSVGRLPVSSLEEARIVVDKLMNYATAPSTLGGWRQDIYYVADDGDFNLHQRDADQLASMVDTAHQEFNVRKIFMDAFPQNQTPNGESAEAVNRAIDDAVKKGALIINYTGHGSEFRWAEETILNQNMISSWKNYDRLPLFVTATCEFGRHDDPKRISGAEKLITNPNGGAIGLVTTARPVFASKNFILNKAFYEIALKATTEGYPTLGDIFKYTKNDSYAIVANRNFALLGDPSMKLAYPQQKLVVSEFTKDQSLPGDTVGALNQVRLKGKVTSASGAHLTDYQGIAEVTVFDKETESETLGSDGGRTFSFKERNSIIFRGQASINSGEFEVNFVVPKNIVYQFGKGKISLYALSNSGLVDAGGASNSFVIGGSNKNAPLDNTPPQISLYMDDTSFVSGGSTGINTMLLAKITDESGINISNAGFGQDITAVLNTEKALVLNDFFKADLDTYQSGWVNYPISNLEAGEYFITLKAWDVYNNSSESELEFVVVENPALALHKVLNYPNPLREVTKFQIDHNQAGSSLEVNIFIYNQQGQLIHTIQTNYHNSPSTLNEITWEGNNHSGVPLDSGLYLYKVVVRSLNTGDKSEEYRKLVIIK